MAMDFKQEIINLLKGYVNLKEEELFQLLTVPPDPKRGDYAFPCFKLGKDAPKKAAELRKNIFWPDFISKVDVIGPYLNFFLKESTLAEETLIKIFQARKSYGRQKLGKGKNILIEFSSPNIAKPFGIGHLRSTVIGDSLYKILNFLDYNVTGVNHLGDWGTQFGKLIAAYKKWGKEKELENDPIKYLLKLYVKFHHEADKDDSLNELARAEFKKLEDGNPESLALWESFKELSLQEFRRIYHLLDIEFDSYHGEAFYNNLLNKTITKLQQQVKTENSEGALIVNLEKYNMPPLMLRKTDGASTYHTRDVAAALYRLKKYRPQKIIYVVGGEQKLHFRQLFKVLELSGVDKDRLIHVEFGLFHFPEGKMSTRKGKVIFLEDVLNKAISLAQRIIDEKNPQLKNKEEVAKQVGVGAIIFADLSRDRVRNIDFDWEKMLSFEGETAPYLQYTHARACSILRKAKQEWDQGSGMHVNFETFDQEEEMTVVKQLYTFPDVLVKVAETYKPHHLAQYLLSLAQRFNEFYHKCPVISEQKQIMKARLLLVDCVRQVLENGLSLLGIKAPEEM